MFWTGDRVQLDSVDVVSATSPAGDVVEVHLPEGWRGLSSGARRKLARAIVKNAEGGSPLARTAAASAARVVRQERRADPLWTTRVRRDRRGGEGDHLELRAQIAGLTALTGGARYAHRPYLFLMKIARDEGHPLCNWARSAVCLGRQLAPARRLP